MTVVLRDYQDECVANVRREFKHTRRVLLQAPTGSGKTIMFSHIAHSAAQKDKRILIMAHRHQIVTQISAALTSFGLRHGLIAPGYTMTNDLLQIGMVQTIARRLGRMAAPDLIITDECHHGTSDQYQIVYRTFSKALSLGVSATPERLDGRGLAEVYDVIVNGPRMRWLIDNNYLSNYDYYSPPPIADFASLHTKYGDFDLAEMAELVDQASITGDVIDHYRMYLNGAPSIAFCVNVAHAEHVAGQFRSEGIRSYSIDGKMDRDRQSKLIKGLADGSVEVLTSCNLISEGVDVPVVSGAILLRRTKSLTNFLQSVGRTFRLKPNGGRATLLDHVGNIALHGAPAMDRQWSLDGRPKKPKIPDVIHCDMCQRDFYAGEQFDCSFGSLCEQTATAGEPTVPPSLEQIAGTLVLTDESAWAQGQPLDDVTRYAVADLERKAAGDREKLKQIAKARHYHHKWVDRAVHRWRDSMVP